MAVLARSLIASGTLFLIHAAYSAQEHSQLAATAAPNSPFSSSSSSSQAEESLSSFALTSLPADIAVETLLALVLLTLGIVLSSEPLMPIRWHEWAAEVEHGTHGPKSRYMKQGGADGARVSAAKLGQQLYGGPGNEGYDWLEDGKRMGFFDIRSRRKQFAEWAKKEGEKGK